VSLKGDPVQILAADHLIFVLVARPSAARRTGTYLIEIDPLSGHTGWNLVVPNNSQIAYESGVVVVAGGDTVQGFKASTGASLWNVPLPGAVAVTPADGQVYVDAAGDAATAESIAAINVTTGKVTWSATPPTPIAAGPLAVAGDRVYRAEQNQAQAFDRTNGKLIWHVKTTAQSTGPATATLSGEHLFAPTFTPGNGAPGDMIAGGPLSDANGTAQSGVPAEIVSGDTGLMLTPEGVIANDVATGTYIWSAYTHPLAILNDQAVTFGKNAIELRSLASGKLEWWANMAGSANDAVTAVGNGELLVGTAAHLTALLSYNNSAVPKVRATAAPAYATYDGPPAKVTGTISQPGITQAYAYAIAGRPANGKQFGTPAIAHTKPSGTFSFTEHPQFNTVYRISLPNSSAALSLFEVIALPHIGYRFGKPLGGMGQVTITLKAPARIHLGGRKTSLYIGRAKTKHYELLGTGRLKGKSGTFKASFEFKLAKHVGKKDFVTACFSDLYRQNMSYGDKLDRRCGAPKIPF
jgi:outer membrane protein assembly factor BamB